jgi:hypothetical protein
VKQAQAEGCSLIIEPMVQIFGGELENLPDAHLEVFAEFLRPYANNPRSKNYHKLIVWLGSVLGIEGLWNRFYGGRYYDVSVNKLSHELSPIDEGKYQFIEEENMDSTNRNILTMGNLLVHTKSTILLLELFRNLMQISMPVIFVGKHDSGKSTLLKLLFSNLRNLSTSSPAKEQRKASEERSSVGSR